jgi:hypothetical protein
MHLVALQFKLRRTTLTVSIFLKPRLHDQFLCDNFSYFYVRNVFGRVDETANNC